MGEIDNKELLDLVGYKEPLKENVKKALNIFSKIEQAEQFNNIQPIFYDRAGLFWLWNSNYFRWEVTDEVDLLNMIMDSTGRDVINSKNRTEIINVLKQLGRKNIPKPIRKSWIQFKDKIYDIKTGESFIATPEYFVTNPIPWEVNSNPETPTIDKIFKEWVGEKFVETLYEILAYSLLPDYPIHRLFCFLGAGLNGKGKFQTLLRIFLGENNCCATELDSLINSRFEITRLHKKLICLMGETDFNEISKTSILKKLTGGDLIGYEYKNKNPFEDINYAKIIIATNNLPSTTDKTIGFYRRWLIIPFPNRFTEKKDILSEIPTEEFNNLATRCLITLNKLLEKREFSNEGTIEERMKVYEDNSNPVEKFIKEQTEEDLDGFIWKFEFEKRLNAWCKENHFRNISETSIGRKMKELGYTQNRKYSDWLMDGQKKMLRIWEGIKWK